MASYNKWNVKNVLHFFSLISDGLGSVYGKLGGLPGLPIPMPLWLFTSKCEDAYYVAPDIHFGNWKIHICCVLSFYKKNAQLKPSIHSYLNLESRRIIQSEKVSSSDSTSNPESTNSEFWILNWNSFLFIIKTINF